MGVYADLESNTTRSETTMDAEDKVQAAQKELNSQGGTAMDGSSKEPKLGPEPPKYTGHESAKAK